MQAMDPNEQTEFLTETKCIAKLSTLEKDGTIHTVPVWYMYEKEQFIVTSDLVSHHVKNIRRDPNVTVLIDTVQFPTKGVRVKGSASIQTDPNKVHALELEITERYVADKNKAAEYVKKREKMLRNDWGSS